MAVPLPPVHFMATTDYGSDFSCITDLDAKLSTVSGPLVVGQAILRRYITPRGGLWYDPEYGTDLRQFLNGARSRFAVARACELEALKDDRVQQASAEVEITRDTMTIVVRLTLADGPFALTVSVSSLTVEMIEFSQAA